MASEHPQIAYRDRIPLAWEPREADPEPARLDRANAAGLTLAQGALQWAEQPAAERAEEAGPMQQELARLEGKVNLLLEMVARLVERDLARPPAMPVALGTETLVWDEAATPPAEGQRLWVSLYLLPELPRPLELAARVEAVTEGEGAPRVTARLEGTSEALRDAIAKLAFRQHRRGIARNRKA
jgi:hypothetical protein